MGAGEFLIIAVLGLLVLGPERLPVAIRTVSGWVRTIKQMANSVTAEMSHELKVHELHQNLKKAEEQGLDNLSPELQASVQELKDAAASVTRTYAEGESGNAQPTTSVEALQTDSDDVAPSAVNEPTKDPAKDKVKSDE